MVIIGNYIDLVMSKKQANIKPKQPIPVTKKTTNFNTKDVKELKSIMFNYNIKDSDIEGSGKNGCVTKADRITAIRNYESDNGQQLNSSTNTEQFTSTKAKKTTKKEEMIEMDDFTIIFYPYSQSKSKLECTFSMEKGNYSSFFMTMASFFTTHLDESEVDMLLKKYPKLNKKGKNLNEVFGHTYTITGITEIRDKCYVLNWSI